MKERKLPRHLEKKVVARSNHFAIEKVKLEFSNKAIRNFERMIKTKDTVLVVPVWGLGTDEKSIVLIVEYMLGTEEYHLCFPKGGINPSESLFDAANRELSEEAGYKAKNLTKIQTLSSLATFYPNYTHIVLARELTDCRSQGDEPEDLEVIKWPLSRASDLLNPYVYINDYKAYFNEARDVSALLLALDYLKD